VSPYKTISPLTKYKDEIDRLKTALDVAFGAGTRANPSAVEDRIIFPLGVATRDLCEEVIWFVHQGFGNAALRTSRTLYECVVFCLYINKHPDSWENYLGTMHSQWAKIMQNVPGADRNLPQIHNVLLEKVPKYGRGKTAFISLDWNDEGTTHKMAADVGISNLFHSLAFNYASGFVHPSAMFLLHNLTQSTPDGPLLTGTDSDRQEWKFALQISHDMTINAMRLRTKYSDSGALRCSLALCEQDFSNVWGYAPQLTPPLTEPSAKSA
jgi:hypothetical protein